MTIARLQKAADKLEATRVGYDQSQRWSFFDRTTRTLRPGGECDCSSGCGAIAALAGYPVRLADPFSTANFVQRFVETGLFRALPFTGLSQVRAGDFVLGAGHVVFARTATRWWSAESDERGKSSGGRAGDQTGKEARFRGPYLRSRGWTHIVRLITPTEFLRRAVAAYAAGKSPSEPLRLLAIRAPWDGPRWAWFLDQWKAADRGLALTYEPGRLRVPADGHAFVVLGSALSSAGKVSTKFRERLQLAQRALRLNPASRVLITGGAPKAGMTEAQAGRQWLIAGGIDPDRILIEERSASTVGNARGSVPILRASGITSWTPVSHASHLRRVLVLFTAARVLIETAENRKLPLEPVGALAVDDYTPKPNKVSGPVAAGDRTVIADQVRALIGL